MPERLLRIPRALKHLFTFYLIFGLGWTAGCIFESIVMVSLLKRGP